MSHYRGFGFSRVPRTGPLGVHAQALDETGPWSGRGWVGMMPDLSCAKAYVDWLHDVGPEGAPVPSIDDGIEGHFVVVNGRDSDADAIPAERLSRIADALRDPKLDTAGVDRAFGALVRTVQSIDIAAEQNQSARAIGNFFLTPSDRDGIRCERMHLGNFGLPGEWNGDGLIAVGIGDGWAHAIARNVMAKSVRDFPDRNIGTPDAPSRYARTVFVAGPEPRIDVSSREDLDNCRDVLRSVLRCTVTAEIAGYLVPLPGILEAAAAQLEASCHRREPGETPDPAPRP
jgi:hypothetical protein